MNKLLRIDEEFIVKCLEIGKELIHKDYSISIRVKEKNDDECYIYIRRLQTKIRHLYRFVDFSERGCIGFQVLLFNEENKALKLIDSGAFSYFEDFIKYEFMSIDDFEVVGGNNE